MIREKINMVPRHNWDYRFADFTRAFSAAFSEPAVAETSLRMLFDEKPILTTSGRASLYVILKSLNLQAGSHVGVPLFTCPVVFDTIFRAGLFPRFIDINPDDYTVSLDDLKRKKDSISALIVVHMFGHPADMDSVSDICGNTPVIEDCAQALLSEYKGNYAGLLSDVSFFSFRSGKYVSAGEGSAIFARNPVLHTAVQQYVEELGAWSLYEELSHCMSVYIKSTLYHKPWYGTVGLPIGRILDKKLNLTAKTGFVLRKISKSDRKIIDYKIGTFAENIKKQRQNSHYLLENLKMDTAILPTEKPGCRSNYFQFAIRFSDREQRDMMAEHLFRKGIDAAKYLDDIADVSTRNYGYAGDCPNSEMCSKTVLVIPNHYTLSQAEIENITTAVNTAASWITQ